MIDKWFKVKRLEPEEGLPHLKHYEIKLLKNKQFDLTFYKSGDTEKFQTIMKFLKKSRQKSLSRVTGYIYYIFLLN